MSQQVSSSATGGGGGSIGRFLLFGGASVLVAQVVGLGSGTATHMLLARLLAPEHLAAFFLTQSVIEVGAGLSNLGLPRPLTRFVAQAMGRERPDEARGVLHAALPLWLAGITVAAGLYLGGVGDWLALGAFHSEIMASGTVLAAGWLVFQASSELLAGALRGFRRVGLAAWVANPLPRLLTAAVLLFWFLGPGESGLVPVLALTLTAALVACLVALLPLWRRLADVVSSPLSRRVLLASAMPLMVTQFAQMAYMRLDTWTVGVLFEPDKVALYGVAKRLIVLTSLPLMVLNLVVPPVVAELHARQDVERLQRALRGAATLVGLPALGVLGAMWVWSEPLLGLAFGPFFREAAPVLSMLCLERLVFVWVGPSGMVLAMTGNERSLMVITIGTSLLTLLAVVVGAQLYGFLGVAGGFVAGSTGQQLATWATVRRLTGMRTDLDPANLGSALDALRRALRR